MGDRDNVFSADTSKNVYHIITVNSKEENTVFTFCVYGESDNRKDSEIKVLDYIANWLMTKNSSFLNYPIVSHTMTSQPFIVPDNCILLI